MSNASPTGQLPVGRQMPLDVLRGFALLGILFVNWQFLAYPVASDYARAAFPDASDRIAAWCMQFFCDGKFILIFSFLFGYGLHVQMTRAAAAGESALPRYRRRLIGLLIIGLIHAVFLFVGDILVTYALLGFLLIPFRNMRPRTLLAGAGICWLLSLIGHGLLGWAMANYAEPGGDAARALAVYRNGTVGAIVAERLGELAGLYAITPLLFMPQVFGMFLLGLAAAKSGLLVDVRAETAFWRRVLLWSMPIAVVGNAVYVTMSSGGEWLGTGQAGAAIGSMVGRAVFSPFGAAAYVSGLVLLLGRDSWSRRLAPLATDGRMSLTNYVGESLLCCILFHSYGFQLYGHIGPADGVVVVLMIFAFQMMFSDWCLLRFRMGPLEWVMQSWVNRFWAVKRSAA